jgi:16S rRNA C1402 (ribose-2'-O) methylase RsmI
MKRLLVLLFLLSSIISYAQKTNNSDVYENISRTFCNCVNKDTLANSIEKGDSCLKLSLKKNYTMIKQEGIDTAYSNPSFYKELSKKIMASCPEYRERVAREIQKKQESEYRQYQEELKTTYSGVFVSQTKLSNGEYELVIKSNKNNSTRTFISKTSINEKEAAKPKAEVSVKFKSNTSSLRAKYQFRAESVSIIGIVEVRAQ